MSVGKRTSPSWPASARGVQERWRRRYDQLTDGQDYKDHETPGLKRLLKEGQHMADAGYMSEQDSARLSQLRDEALKACPRSWPPRSSG